MSDQTRKNCLQTKQRTGGGVMSETKELSVEETKLIIDWLEDYYQMELYADTKKLPDVVNKLKESDNEA